MALNDSVQMFIGESPTASISVEFVDYRSKAEIAVQVLAASIINIVAIFGNFLVIYAIHQEPSLRTTTNRVVECLSWTDFLNAVLVIPFFVVNLAFGEWVFSEALCRVEGFFYVTFAIATVDTLTVIAINRLLKVVFPKLFVKVFGSVGKINAIFIFVWLLAIAIGGAPFLGWGEFAYMPPCFVCTTKSHPKHMSYLWVLNAFSGYSATTFMIGCYIWIYIYHRFSVGRMVVHANSNSIPNEHMQRQQRHADWKLLKMTSVVAVFYLVCWLPVAVMVNLKQHGVDVPLRSDAIAVLMQFLNSSGNPIIYWCLIKRFRRAITRILKCRRINGVKSSSS